MQTTASNGFWVTRLVLERKRQRAAVEGGAMEMFDRTQFYVAVALLGVFELAVVLVRTVAQ